MVRVMMLALALVLGFLAQSSPARAERTFEGCSKSQTKIADTAISGSLQLATQAAATVGDTEQYAFWFGPFSANRAETVRANLKSVVAELRTNTITTVCLRAKNPDCKDGAYAFVLHDRPHAIHLCPSFFAMPSLEDAQRGVGDMENGTREGTIIHETSHFPYTAHTSDECYSRSTCHAMAWDKTRVIRNADSYQYFAEDVALMSMAKAD